LDTAIPAELLQNNGQKRWTYNKKPVKKNIADRRCPPAANKFDFPETFMRPNKETKNIDSKTIETVEPVGKRVLIRKDEDKKETKGGIKLPDNIEIPTITGRIVAVSAEVENMPEIPLKKYDKVLFNPKGAIPVDFEGDNRLFVVEIENIVAVFRKA
jgi:chaperonin GroES